MRFILFPVIQGAPNRGKALQAGDDHIVGSTGAVDDQQIAVFIPAAYDSYMGVLWVKYQVAGLDLIPLERVAVGVLGVGPTAVADDIFTVADIIESPVHK